MFTLFGFLLALGILVTIHEWGHFYVARRCGVKVLRFSVGFGKPLFSWQDRLGTEYVIAAIPLGGYVKMLDEREGEVSEDELPQAFSRKTVWQRMAIVVAGPVANFILAAILYFALALSGSTGLAPVLGDLPETKLAYQSGLREGGEITAVDGYPVSVWSEVYARLSRRIGDSGDIVLTVVPEQSTSERQYRLSVSSWLHDADQPDLLASLGLSIFQPDGEAVVAQVVSGSPAEQSGLQALDKVLLADGVNIESWQQWVEYVRIRPEQNIKLTVLRSNELIDLQLIPEKIEDNGNTFGRVGIMADIDWPQGMLRDIEYSLPQSLVKGVSDTFNQATFILAFVKKLVLGQVSTKNLSGSLTIAKAAGDSAKAGIASYLAFLAFLSVSLGVFNLLPIPVLDGGHLLYYVIEAIKGSPVPEKIQLLGYQVGLFFVLAVMIVAHVNDVMRFFAS